MSTLPNSPATPNHALQRTRLRRHGSSAPSDRRRRCPPTIAACRAASAVAELGVVRRCYVSRVESRSTQSRSLVVRFSRVARFGFPSLHALTAPAVWRSQRSTVSARPSFSSSSFTRLDRPTVLAFSSFMRSADSPFWPVVAGRFLPMPATPNHALQRTAPRVTLAAADHPAACAHPAPAALPAASAPRSAVAELGVVRRFRRTHHEERVCNNCNQPPTPIGRPQPTKPERDRYPRSEQHAAFHHSCPPVSPREPRSLLAFLARSLRPPSSSVRLVYGLPSPHRLGARGPLLGASSRIVSPSRSGCCLSSFFAPSRWLPSSSFAFVPSAPTGVAIRRMSSSVSFGGGVTPPKAASRILFHFAQFATHSFDRLAKTHQRDTTAARGLITLALGATIALPSPPLRRVPLTRSTTRLSGRLTANSETTNGSKLQFNQAPNHALQRTRSAVMPCASVPTSRATPAMHRARQLRESLSLGSFGVAARFVFNEPFFRT